MTLKYWDFSKDKTSTKIPTSGGTEIDVKLKEETSIVTPTFILNFDTTPVFTYCQYMFWYFYVEDIVFITKNVYEVKCSLDVLATYRDDILNSYQFVLRSASEYNLYAKDNEVIPTYLQEEDNYDTPVTELSGSSFLVRIMGKNFSNTGSVSSYGISTFAMGKQGLQDLVAEAFDNAIFSNTTWSLDDLGNLLKCIFFDPQSYIISVNWLPVNVQTDNQFNQIYLGWWGTQQHAGLVTGDGDVYQKTITSPTRYFNDFRDFDTNFTQFTLSLPCVGLVTLNPDDVYAGLGVLISIEYLTGTLIYNIYRTDTDAVINKYKTNVNCEIQIGGVTHGINTGSIESMIADTASELIPTAPEYKTIGNIGSQIEISRDNVLRLNRRIYHSLESPLLNKGKPLGKYKQLKTLSGYCQCNNAILNTDAYGEVKERILEYMDDGFIIE